MKLPPILLAAAVACAPLARAAEPAPAARPWQRAEPRFTYDDLEAGRFRERTVEGVRPLDEEHFSTLREGAVYRVAYATGREELLFDGRELGIEEYAIDPAGRLLLVSSDHCPIYRRSYTADYHLVGPGGEPRELAPGVARKRSAVLSPDGLRVAFVADNDLYAVDLTWDGRPGEPYALTRDGRPGEIINGVTDWVYEEEFAFTCACAFSPDGQQLAFLRFDERAVPEYELMRFDGQLYNRPYRYKYPKAGEPNSVVSLHVYDFRTGNLRSVDTGADTAQYIPRFGWTPGGLLWYVREPRLQNRIEMRVVAPDGSQRTAYCETSPRYIERVDDGTIRFLDDDRFIVRQESETGWMHLYLYTLTGGRSGALTAGAWEVTELVGCDGERIWYLSTERSPRVRDLYVVGLDGSGKRLLTPEAGFHRVLPSVGMRYYLDYASSVASPLRVTLHRGDGTHVRTLEENGPLRELVAGLKVPEKEFFRFATERGDTLDGYVVRPSGFDPLVRYPVLVTQYSGPGSQSVQNRWTTGWEDVMVQYGYVVVCTDGRGTGFRGEHFKKSTYGQLGRMEVEDQLSTARFVAGQPWADPARIGIYGWSYGGFMTLGCLMQGGALYRMGIAVAPVTSWRYYDSVYTEIYNGLPSQNAAGYDDYSPLGMADGLQSRLLLIHGTGDDNVHFQNTVEMVRALTAAGKMFDLALYPDDNHSMLPRGRHHIRRRMIAYTLEHL